jgi:hypothetical protein
MLTSTCTPPHPQVGNQTQRTAVVQQSLNPVYNTHHEFFNIQTHDVIRIRVGERAYMMLERRSALECMCAVGRGAAHHDVQQPLGHQ